MSEYLYIVRFSVSISCTIHASIESAEPGSVRAVVTAAIERGYASS